MEERFMDDGGNTAAVWGLGSKWNIIKHAMHATRVTTIEEKHTATTERP
jgi:hypothetical protein